DEVLFQFTPASTMVVLPRAAIQLVANEAVASAYWRLRADAWGRRRVGLVAVRCRAGGLWQGGVGADTGPPGGFPPPPAPPAPTRPTLVPPDLLRRIGDHISPTAGEGIEFAGIRDYVPGDRLRDVNWRVSSRRRQLHVNQRAAQRAADLIVMIDAFSDVGPPG